MTGTASFDGDGTAAAESRIPRPWWIYRGTGLPLHDFELSENLPPAPPWRTFDGRSALRPGADPDPKRAGSGSGRKDLGRVAAAPVEPAPPPESEAELRRRLGATLGGMPADPTEADLVNAALILRRPLLVTGRPGTGKSTLAYRISRELRLGRVLRWPITSHTTLRSGLYRYDAVGRIHAAATYDAPASDDAPRPMADAPVSNIGSFLELGPLGTALLPYALPRVLLIDEFDKSDMDLPNDLLDVFEAGEFTVPELARMRSHQPVVEVRSDDTDRTVLIENGRVRCREFPLVVITSNGERDFPPAFLRRCLHLHMEEPEPKRLADIVAAHLGPQDKDPRVAELIRTFAEHSAQEQGLATDQLLNSIWLATSGAYSRGADWDTLLRAVWHRLDGVRDT
ncbi:AAA family ATPase [Streptomyces sp. NPDC050538]|uniref:AAA family ATPase n=1 Tax=Streptomyces sp. NPDC050538 TaxID=3365627 RepID=UPI00379F7D3D